MARIAFYTFGVLKATRDSELLQDFWERLPSVFEKAERMEGFIDRSGYSPSARVGDRPVWGDSVKPRFFIQGIHADALATLSLWSDLESVSAFAYHGLHGEALQKRKEWFLEPEWPTYVAWWVDDHHLPTWREGADQLERLVDDGPTKRAFDFVRPFDSSGEPTTVDREAVRVKWTAAER